MRSLILALLLMLGSAYAVDAPPASDPVQLPAQDFTEMTSFATVLSQGRILDDGRQIVLLGNGMAFVSVDAERIGAVKAGCKAAVSPIFGTIDGRHGYRIECATPTGATYMNGIRFQ